MSAEVNKKYQLRGLYLINAGTNMHTPSLRITKIDPRGGAAVVGDNGVGKTTTLRIFPLFFGHLPSQIISSGQGQEAMIRFILPTDASAVAFEYQRGSDDESDLRLAVIRRRGDDPDSPFYRLYRCGFRKELFVDGGRFLSDDEAQAKATAMGVLTTSKLTPAEYRSVILRVPAMSKKKDELRRYAVDWSFGPKQLDNLDRVVAAMVKKHISFSDIVQVAVGLVQHDLGQGSERSRLVFKQGRAPIERWLQNREACLSAFKLAPSFSEMEEDLKEHRLAEAGFRACHSDVLALSRIRAQAAVELRQKHGLAQGRNDEEGRRAAADREVLANSVASKDQLAVKARQAYAHEKNQDDYFANGQAEFWGAQLENVPGWKSRHDSLTAQIDAAEKVDAEAREHYAQLRATAQKNAADLSFEQERSKAVHHKRLSEIEAQINASENDALRALADEMSARRRSIDESIEPLQLRRGSLENQEREPVASGVAISAAEEAAKKVFQQQEELLTIQGLAGRAATEFQAASHDFEKKEAEVRRARAGVTQANEALELAVAQQKPSEGTLWAALLSSPSDDWKRGLAKVISPGLLQRTDLSPALVEEGSRSVCGWSLDVGVIPAPDWSDDSFLRQQVEAATSRLASSETHLARLQQELARCSLLRGDAELKVQTTESRLRVLEQQLDRLKAQSEAAALRVANERRDGSRLAAAKLAEIKAQIDALKEQKKGLEREYQIDMGRVKTSHSERRAQARKSCEAALSAVDVSIEGIRQSLQATLKGLTAQLDEHLSCAGVDVSRLSGLRSEASDLQDEIHAVEGHRSLVESWRLWLDSGGPVRLDSLTAAMNTAVAEFDLARKVLSDFNHDAEDAERARLAEISGLERQIDATEQDTKLLDELLVDFGSYQPVGASTVSAETNARDLRNRVNTVRQDLKRLEESIGRRSSSLHQRLTARNNAVKEFVEASLDASPNGDVISRAMALATCYKEVGPQVANDVNLTLKTLLANLAAFQKSIHMFEREVGEFNRRLQAGLSEVRCFERVKDLRLDVVTNFESLGFYKKLSRMDEIARDHANEVGKDYSRDIPSDETARALSDFLSVLGNDGNVEVNLSSHITLKGRVIENGQIKEFRRASELENISSEGLTSLILITLMTALLNTIRGAEPVHVPWVTDEVGKFDPKNLRALLNKLKDNRIDVVTASPDLGSEQSPMFARRYIFEDRGRIRECGPA